jgi:hypothetical protein
VAPQPCCPLPFPSPTLCGSMMTAATRSILHPRDAPVRVSGALSSHQSSSPTLPESCSNGEAVVGYAAMASHRPAAQRTPVRARCNAALWPRALFKFSRRHRSEVARHRRAPASQPCFLLRREISEVCAACIAHGRASLSYAVNDRASPGNWRPHLVDPKRRSSRIRGGNPASSDTL